MINYMSGITRKQGRKYIVLGIVSLILMISCFGCSGSSKGKVSVEEAKKTIVMELEDYDVTLSEYNLFLIQYITMQNLNPDDITEERLETIKSDVANEIKLEIVEYLLAQKMEDLELDEEATAGIDKNTSKYIEQYGAEFLADYGIDEAAVKQLFTEQAYIKALTDKAKEDMANDNYEENAEKMKDVKFHTVYYALFPSVEYDDEGNPVTDDKGENVLLSDEQMKEQKKKAEELQKRAASGEKLEDLIKEYGIDKYSGEERNYEGAYTDQLNKVIEKMEKGDISDVVETDAGYMVVRMDNPNDTDYKEYALRYAGVQYANKTITTLQQNWLSASGCANVEPDEEALKKVDITSMTKQLKENGIY